MNEGGRALIEMLFSFGTVLAIAGWQLFTLRRDRQRDREAAKQEQMPDHALVQERAQVRDSSADPGHSQRQ